MEGLTLDKWICGFEILMMDEWTLCVVVGVEG